MADREDHDVRARVVAAERALAPVLADLERTCDIAASIGISADDGALQVWVRDGSSSAWSARLIDDDPEVAKAEMADHVQEQLMDVGVARFWPSCIEHDRGLHAEVRDGSAVWFCRGGDHTVARVGFLDRG